MEAFNSAEVGNASYQATSQSRSRSNGAGRGAVLPATSRRPHEGRLHSMDTQRRKTSDFLNSLNGATKLEVVVGDLDEGPEPAARLPSLPGQKKGLGLMAIMRNAITLTEAQMDGRQKRNQSVPTADLLLNRMKESISNKFNMKKSLILRTALARQNNLHYKSKAIPIYKRIIGRTRRPPSPLKDADKPVEQLRDEMFPEDQEML